MIQMKNKLIIFAFSVLVLSSLCACSKNNDNATLPDKHPIEYDEKLDTTDDEYGADSYNGCLDSKDSKYYFVNDYYNMKSSDSLHIISNFETYQQTTEYTCGCASLLMVLHYYGINDYNEMQIAEIAGTNDTEGTTVEGLYKVLDNIGIKYEGHNDTNVIFDTNESAEDYFIKCIDKGMPVMVDWEDWGGHWQVVIGLDTCSTEEPDDDVLIIADPYDVTDHYQDGYYTFSFARFMSMWREGNCAGKEIPYEQPYITVIK